MHAIVQACATTDIESGHGASWCLRERWRCKGGCPLCRCLVWLKQRATGTTNVLPGMHSLRAAHEAVVWLLEPA